MKTMFKVTMIWLSMAIYHDKRPNTCLTYVWYLQTIMRRSDLQESFKLKAKMIKSVCVENS